MPMTAPSRTCAWCQIRVPAPIVARGETSAVGCTKVEVSAKLLLPYLAVWTR